MLHIEDDRELIAKFGEFGETEYLALYCGDDSDEPDMSKPWPESCKWPEMWAIDALCAKNGMVYSTFCYTDDYYLETIVIDILDRKVMLKFFDTEKTASLCQKKVLEVLSSNKSEFKRLNDTIKKLSSADKDAIMKWYSDDSSFVIIGKDH